jgi:hypothetical protein
VLVALASGSLEVGLYLDLQSLSEHLPCYPASYPVEVERELLMPGLILVYPVHRCTLPAGVGASAFSGRSLEGNVHHVSQRILDPQLLSTAHGSGA